jgi:hypothetical protein
MNLFAFTGIVLFNTMRANNRSQERRAENEVAFKQRNEKVKDLAKALLDRDSQENLTLNFYCECSDETCKDEIAIPLEEFEHMRENHRQFLVKAGHEQADIETIAKRREYFVVEKFNMPPPTDGKLNRTH